MQAIFCNEIRCDLVNCLKSRGDSLQVRYELIEIWRDSGVQSQLKVIIIANLNFTFI